MHRSHAQEALNRTLFVEGTEIQDHIKLLRTRKAAVDNLSTAVMNEETWIQDAKPRNSLHTKPKTVIGQEEERSSA